MRNTHLPFFSVFSIITIFVVLQPSTCCAAADYNLRFYDDSDGLSHWHVSQTIQDSSGMVWVATWNGLNRFDGSQFVTFKPALGDGVPIHGDRIRRMRLMDDNNLLCLIDDRIFLFNTISCTFDTLSTEAERVAEEFMRRPYDPDFMRPKEKFNSYGNLQMRNIWSEYTDHQNNLWLINDHGLYVATPMLSHGRRINDTEVRCMHRMNNGDIWASVRNSHELMVMDSTLRLRGYMDSNGALHAQPVDFGHMVYSVCETEDGHVLLGCKPGSLLDVPKHKGQADMYNLREAREYPELRNVYDIKPDREGRLWVATFGFGLWREVQSDEGSRGREFEPVPGTANMFMRRLLFTEDGTMLAATTAGLLVLDNKGLRLHQRQPDDPHSLSSNAVICLCLHNGNLYVGTEGGGVNIMRGQDIHAEHIRWDKMTTQDGLETDIVFEIIPWSSHELLLQGNTALTIVDTNYELAKASDDGGALRPVNYGKSFFGSSTNGKLILGEVPPVLLSSGRVLVAPASGLVVLDREEFHPEQDSIRIALSMLRCGNQPTDYAVDGLQHITLTPKERSMLLGFSALDFRNTGTVLYATRFYELGQSDEPWGVPTKINAIALEGLQPGEYVFEVRSTNIYGHWQNNTRRITISVPPTFIESRLGKGILITILLIITLFITIICLQLKMSVRRREETLNAFLELQERYLLMSNQQATMSQQQSSAAVQPLPVPEILAPGYTSENEKFLNRLHQFMEERLGDSNMTIDDIARVTNMSRSSLNRKMHELFDLSAKDFVQAARIKHACQLLRTTDMAAKEVAYACGFSDPRYFSKSFKANTGKTPTEFREGSSQKKDD